MLTTPLPIQAAIENATNQLRTTSPSPDLDAQVLLAHILNVSRSYLFAWGDRVVISQDKYDRYAKLITRRANGEPIAYLVGTREFWSLPLTVTPDTLIPRPETERLVELCLQSTPQEESIVVCDLGTGSGAIALALARERPHWRVLATDVSTAALDIARLNAQTLGITNVNFVLGSWFEPLPEQTFQIVVSNPPYVCENDPHLLSGSLPYEPHLALVSPDEGLAALSGIAQQARTRLSPGGKIFLEHGFNQQPRLIALLTDLGYAEIKGYDDLNGIPRVVSARWKV